MMSDFGTPSQQHAVRGIACMESIASTNPHILRLLLSSNALGADTIQNSYTSDRGICSHAASLAP